MSQPVSTPVTAASARTEVPTRTEASAPTAAELLDFVRRSAADQNLTISLKPIPPPVSFQGSRIGPAAAALERVGPEGLPPYRPRAQYCNFMQPMKTPPIGRKSFTALSEPQPSVLGACGEATTLPRARASRTGP